MTTPRRSRSLPRANGTLMARKINKCSEGCPHASGTRLVACVNVVERVTRIELALSAWEADVLPLNYTRARPSVQLRLGNVLLTRRPVWI
jgi:hypothetical protein